MLDEQIMLLLRRIIHNTVIAKQEAPFDLLIIIIFMPLWNNWE